MQIVILIITISIIYIIIHHIYDYDQIHQDFQQLNIIVGGRVQQLSLLHITSFALHETFTILF